MGKLVLWNKRRGWQVGWTPYQYRIAGLHFFQRRQFKGLTPRSVYLFRKQRYAVDHSKTSLPEKQS